MMAGLTQPSDPLLPERLYLYLGRNVAALELWRDAGLTGFVLHGAKGFGVAAELRRHGYDGPLLIDPERYTPVRADANQGTLVSTLDVDLEAQRSMEVDAYLSPSVLPPPDDFKMLRRVLTQGSRFVDRASTVDSTRPAFVTLVLSARWLRRVDEIVAEIRKRGLPVALIMAGSRDPLATIEAIRALALLIEAAPRVIVLRCDLAAVGALALGVDAGAMGASSNVRHLYLGRGGPGGPPRLYVFVPAFGTWFDIETIDYIEGVDGFFACPHDPCAGEDVRRFAESLHRPYEPAHAIRAARAVADRLLTQPSEARLGEWLGYVREREHTFRALREDSGAELVVPSFIRAWQNAWVGS